MESQVWLEFAVYHPPMEGLPYLAVVIGPKDMVFAKQFDTLEEAEAFKTSQAAHTAQKSHGDEDA